MVVDLYFILSSLQSTYLKCFGFFMDLLSDQVYTDILLINNIFCWGKKLYELLNSSLIIFLETISTCHSKDSIRTMLNVVQYLRQQDRPKEE